MGRKIRKRLNTLGVHTAIMIILVCFISAATAVYVSYRVYSETSDTMTLKNADNIAKTAASFIDAETIRDYAYDRERDEAYETTFRQLKSIRENNDVTYLYVEVLEKDKAIFIMDTDPVAPYGFREEAELSLGADLSELSEGIPAFMVRDASTNYLWMVSVGEPVKNALGETVAIVGVDMSVDEIVNRRYAFLYNMIALLFLVTVALIVFFVWMNNLYMVRPIKRLSRAARDFFKQGDLKQGMTNVTKPAKYYPEEIRTLYQDTYHMEKDLLVYIDDLTKATAERERIGVELDLARNIQMGALPRADVPFLKEHGIRLSAFMSPAKEVGGDFYDFFMIDEDHLGLVIADVSGKGVPAALFMMISKMLIKIQSTLCDNPAEILRRVNEMLCENNRAEMFVTVWLGFVDLRTGKMRAANAGHEYPAICRKNGKFELIKDRHGLVLGGMPGVKYREYEVDLADGDTLFVYTDGVPEATDAGNCLFGNDRMLEALNKGNPADPDDVLAKVREGVSDFVKDAPQFDDITMLCFSYEKQDGKILPFAGN